ncbi:hypothetical protein BpHYR1_025858 [Brachionus plicatilis]|uniref:Uncharacterized protein n=1 Tax=Brachionus plicatilis TaxID=10195 RepID=A0A3M7RDM0_BRAPC|nr:hypothetical protein BpHYR1_025858 [Brachionus plicatilis]
MTASAFDSALIIPYNWNSNISDTNWLKLINPDLKPYGDVLIKPMPELNIPKNFTPSPKPESPATQKIRSQSNSSTFKTLSISSPNSFASSDSNSSQKMFGSNSFKPTRQNWLYSSPKFSDQSCSPKIFQSVLNATEPINFENNEEIVFQGQKSFIANKSDFLHWKGEIPINKYPINEDSSPEIIVKKLDKKIEYDQEIRFRYLRPPTPPNHADIIIQHEKSAVPPAAPPLVIRQEPQKPKTPPPLIIREAPPKPFQKLETRIIKIPAKKIPPPPRKVIIERLPQIPPKPQPILVERWLPYSTPKRRVIYQKSEDLKIEKPKNVIIQWENQNVVINRKFKNLGVVKADPKDYLMKYESEVIENKELPNFVKSFEPLEELNLPSDSGKDESYELIGDFEALTLADKKNIDENDRGIVKEIVDQYMKNIHKSKQGNINFVVDQIIDMVKAESAKMVTFDEGMAIIRSINQKLNTDLSDEEIEDYLKSINLEKNNDMELELFKRLILLKYY